MAVATSACAGWIEEDELDVAEPDADPSLAAVYRYAAVPMQEPEPEPIELEPEPIEPEPEPGRGETLGGRRPTIIRCRFYADVHVRPHLGARDIRRTIHRHENEIRACYNAALRRDPTLTGRATMSFLIQSDGTVPAAPWTSTEIDDARMLVCLSKTIRRWTFPVPLGAGATVVNYPFVFAVPPQRDDSFHSSAVGRPTAAF